MEQGPKKLSFPVKENIPTRENRKGIALVLVLAFLVLITVLVIAFFSTVSTELSGAKGYASETTAQQLANSASQTVIGIIGAATSGSDAQGNPTAWVSQPGMIRTYSTSGTTYYKLYSSGSMTVTSGFQGYNPGGDLDSQWDKKPALYTDLNSPLTDGTGGLMFPIVDPRALTSDTSTSIQGFNYTAAIDGVVTAGTSSNQTAQRLPMPAAWLYVLQNGSIVAPDAQASGANVATFSTSGTNAPSASNPIVGRVAFWTDDETSKINVNTASEGAYWDTPRANSTYDATQLASNQPTGNEFQRYPGHPATTCLSPVFGSLLPVVHTGSNNTFSQFEPYYEMNPRLNWNTPNANLGSQAGTVKAIATVSGTIQATGTLQVRSDRLYASLDEYLFQSGSSTPRTVNPPAPAPAAAAFTNSLMEKAKFFITATSRAPDVNPFNQPQIVMWPINVSGTARTLLDQTLAFCGSVNGYPYYFQRQNSFSPTNDLPATPAAG